MSQTLERTHLPALARGFSLLGSGGGGHTTIQELVLANTGQWPIEMYDVGELPASTPCIAAAYVGSTQFLDERLPGEAPFAALLDAAQRWSGVRAGAVCSAEGAGLNGLTPLLLARGHTLVDADFMGRALPRIDQMSVFVDRLDGLFVICDCGASGVTIVDTGRAEDIERVVRSAIVQAGGVAAAIVGGFTVAALREHAITGSFRRAQRLGEAFDAARNEPFDVLAEALGAALLGSGRVNVLEPSTRGEFSYTVEIACDNGDVARLVVGSEALAFMREGVVEATVPELIVCIDSISRAVVQVDELTRGAHITVMSLPTMPWWRSTCERIGRVSPPAFGLTGMERRP